MEEKNVNLSHSGNAIVQGDRLMLRRAISNLLSNAVRHVPENGKIVVRLETAADASVIIAVENTGECIAPEHLPRLFDRFYRVDASRQRFSEGAGLGLAITRAIARAHGGDICAFSIHDVTRFEIRLPV